MTKWMNENIDSRYRRVSNFKNDLDPFKIFSGCENSKTLRRLYRPPSRWTRFRMFHHICCWRWRHWWGEFLKSIKKYDLLFINQFWRISSNLKVKTPLEQEVNVLIWKRKLVPWIEWSILSVSLVVSIYLLVRNFQSGMRKPKNFDKDWKKPSIDLQDWDSKLTRTHCKNNHCNYHDISVTCKSCDCLSIKSSRNISA